MFASLADPSLWSHAHAKPAIQDLKRFGLMRVDMGAGNPATGTGPQFGPDEFAARVLRAKKQHRSLARN